MDELEATVSVEGISKAVEVYLIANPPEAGATKEEREQIEQNSADIEVLQEQSAHYALKSEIPSINGLATKDYVDQAIGGIEIPEPDFTGYATEKYVDDAIENIEIPSVEGLASEEYVDDAIGAIKIPTVPSAVSAFTNDAGYQTEAQVIALIAANMPASGDEVSY